MFQIHRCHVLRPGLIGGKFASPRFPRIREYATVRVTIKSQTRGGENSKVTKSCSERN